MDIQTFSQDTRTSVQTAKSDNGNKSSAKVEALATVTAKKQLNAAILQSAVDSSFSAGNQSQALLLKTALDGINEALQETQGDNAIQAAYDAGVDVSPAATAERIVSLSTAFFGLFQEQHPELNDEEALAAFVDVISGGIEQGFSEARDILSGLNVLEGEIADNIDKTYDLVQEGLQSFVDSFS